MPLPALVAPAAAETVSDKAEPPSNIDLTPRGYEAMPLPIVSPDAAEAFASRKRSLSDGIPNYVPPAKPSGALSDSFAPQPNRATKSNASRSSLYQEYIWPYNTTASPARQTAKYFYTMANGEKTHCSATIINAQNQSLALTAAHCVYDQDVGGWNRSGYVCPGFNAGTCQLGAWAVRTHVTNTQWITNEAFAYDVALLLLEPNYRVEQQQVNEQVRKYRRCYLKKKRKAKKACRRLERRRPLFTTVTKTVEKQVAVTVQSVVGGQGIVFDRFISENVWSFGYPATDWRSLESGEYNEDYLYWCPQRENFWIEENYAWAIDCAMVGGSSGGGWLSQPDNSWIGYVKSVNSYFLGGLTGVMFGPYLTGRDEGSMYWNWQNK